VAELSRRQFGVLSADQLRRLGFTASSLRRATERGQFERVYPRVFRVTAAPISLDQRYMAALLYGGPGAALCNLSAAQKQGLIGGRPSKIEIICPRRLTARPGLTVVRRRCLRAGDLRHMGSISVVAPARAVLDLCAEEMLTEAEVVLDAALRMGVASLAGLGELLGYASQHRLAGTSAFRRLLSVRGEEEAMSESELESTVIRVLRKASLGLPERQVIVEWEKCHRLDFFFPAHNLILEVDGRKWHSSKERFLADRHRDNAALLEGMRVIRLTWEDVVKNERYVVATLSRALGIQSLL
jgi:very-short-patch-repair endonuclease